MDQQEFVQQAVQRRIDQDIAKRMQVPQANIQRLAVARDSAKTLNAKVKNRPLVMLAQGDSWFDYPLPCATAYRRECRSSHTATIFRPRTAFIRPAPALG